MLNDFYKQFKSGTDIRGVASEGVEGQSVNLTDDVVADMADGFVLWLSKKVSKKPSELKISVGRDSRISGPHIMEITTERFKRCGAEVLCCQLASTPSMFMTTVDLGCDGALQITASHHPFNRNGLKFSPVRAVLRAVTLRKFFSTHKTVNIPKKATAEILRMLTI